MHPCTIFVHRVRWHNSFHFPTPLMTNLHRRRMIDSVLLCVASFQTFGSEACCEYRHLQEDLIAFCLYESNSNFLATLPITVLHIIVSESWCIIM